MMKEKGSILIFTLWVLIILTILSVILSHRVSTDVKLAKYESDSIKATYLARAGVMKMIAELASDNNDYDSLNEEWSEPDKSFEFGKGKVFYGAYDESSRLNLNADVEGEKGEEYKNRLDLLGVNLPAEAVLEYRKGKEFEFMEELFLIDEVTSDIYLALKDFVTIHRGTESKVNINTASEKVLKAILGEDSLVQVVLGIRDGVGLDDIEGTEDDGAFTSIGSISSYDGDETKIDSSLFTVDSGFFRIWAKASFSEDEEIVKSIEAVVSKQGEILHWKEY
ncbi:MAG: general secretion pathway protein GspK [Candidatus Omnitrophica bacterium]|nr:general secretion pathway protein GspK [Candidatus Omnitrophota bacterium]MBU4589334.1 general secretion pathway protein GspK [Candidatus Omnitrophota bacterium]